MWKEICRFEVKYHLRQPLFYIAAFALSLLALLLVSTGASEVFGKAPASAIRDAPAVIVGHLTIFSIIGLFVITAFVASSVLRDFELGTHPFFFTKPVRKFDYLMGRFAGSMAISLALFVLVTAAMAVGRFVPWQDAERLGPFSAVPYIYGLLVLVLPNLLVMGAVFFAVAAWSRRMLVTYLCVVAFLILQDVVEELTLTFKNAFLGSLLEPTGLVALETVTRYWTVAEYNVALPALTGPLLFNRLLWLSVGAVFLGLSFARFSYSRAAAGSWWTRKKVSVAPAPEVAPEERISAPRAAQRFSFLTPWRQWLRQTRFETVTIFRGAPFIVLFVTTLVFVFTFATVIGQNRGVPVYPVTYLMLRAITVSMQMFLIVVVIFYGGELVWRERALGIAGVSDALPAPNWVFLGAKFTALVLVVAAFIAAGILSTVFVQLGSGFTHLEPGLYVRGFLVATYSFVLLAVLSVFVQVVSKNKFIGYLLLIVVLVGRRGAQILGFEHNLYRYGGHSPLPYSDMNGYGHYAEPYLWYSLYWGVGAAILLGLSALLWVRGAEIPLKDQLALARARWRGPVRAFLTVAAIGFASTGAYIYYNTNILNEYLPRAERVRQRASYEREYREYRDASLPRITAVRSEIDIYPDERRVEIRGSYRLENMGSEPIRTLPVSTVGRSDQHDYLPFRGTLRVNDLDLPGHRVVVSDDELGFYVYELDEALPPGATMELGFDVSVVSRGFKNHGMDQRIIANGTFFANKNLFPSLGYSRANELPSPRDRRRQGLPPVERTAAVDDDAARNRNYLDADWTTYETTISTSVDQIAIAPGYLEEEWSEGDRRYFRYKTDAPIVNLAVFLSADYQVARDNWNDVAIEVYYHADHPFNIEQLIETTKISLDYFTVHFGPYQHRQVRIIEVPNYIGLTAFSLASTIPFSESWGFILKVNRRDIDMVSYVTAHEVAHQWWNHQVIPADVQGATLISETLSQYSALMVMENMFGPAEVRRFLEFELDQYLDGRSREQVAEMPLVLVENQPYIHYHRGALIMYALKDYVGEDAINRALRRFLEATSFRGPPYTNSLQLLEYIRDEVPAELQYLIEDMFETITLFDSRVTEAGYRQLDDGRYRVTLRVTARKLRADGRGMETEIPIADWIDIGVFGDEEVLFLEKLRITEPDVCFEVLVDGLPVEAGIDPYNMLIDRVTSDNTTNVSEMPDSGELEQPRSEPDLNRRISPC